MDCESLLAMFAEIGFQDSWQQFIDARICVAFERMDTRREFDAMRGMLEAEDDRAAYLRWHMDTTTPVFGTWNYDKQGP